MFGIDAAVGAVSDMNQAIWNAKEAKKTRSWQQWMSNTAYQRSMKDMRKAGVNPMLVTKLGGASTPSGATSSANFGGALTGLQVGLQRKKLGQELENMKAQVGETKARTMREGKAAQLLDRQIAGQEYANTIANLGIPRATAEAMFWATPDGRNALRSNLIGQGQHPILQPLMQGSQMLKDVTEKWNKDGPGWGVRDVSTWELPKWKPDTQQRRESRRAKEKRELDEYRSRMRQHPFGRRRGKK